MIALHPVYQRFDVDADGLPKILHDIPDTCVMDFFRGLRGRREDERAEVIESVIRHANSYADSLLDSSLPPPCNREHAEDMQSSGRSRADFKDVSIKTINQLVGLMKSKKPGAARMLGDLQVDQELIEFADSLKPIKAAEMRKRLKEFMKDQFGLVARNVFGVWEYRSPDRAVGLEIDFGGTLGQQLRYRVLHREGLGLNFELLWGVGAGDWDYIHQDNFDRSMSILGSVFSLFETLHEDTR